MTTIGQHRNVTPDEGWIVLQPDDELLAYAKRALHDAETRPNTILREDIEATIVAVDAYKKALRANPAAHEILFEAELLLVEALAKTPSDDA